MRSKLINILLIEDNPDDIEIIKKAFKMINAATNVYVVRDGMEAIDFLYHQGKYENIPKTPPPELILGDIYIPGMKGIEVLKKIKADELLKKIPVVVLSVSQKEEDIIKSYDFCCNSFIQKPDNTDKFIELIKGIGSYWIKHNIYAPERYI